MLIDIITIFPKMFTGPFEESIIKRSINKKLVKINIHNLRCWASGKHRTVDDRPFGGGTGMVMKVEPIDKALKDLKLKTKKIKYKEKIILLSPRGKLFNQNMAVKLSKFAHLIFICGHYEGVDERVSNLVDEEISIGDYVLTGGELAAMVIIDAVVRVIPGVLEKKQATQFESFSSKLITEGLKIKYLLEYPQYTRPASYKGVKVPKILLSGNHRNIQKWRLKKAFEITKKRRPDLLKN